MTQRNPANWMPELIGPVNIEADGTPAERRRGGLNFVGATLEDDPDNDRINVTLPGGGEVQDDIARSGGDPSDPIDRVLGFKGVPLETGDTLAVGQVWKKGPGSTLRAGKPTGPDEVDVLDYGAVAGNSASDNTAAFFAACEAAGDGGVIRVPRGVYYFKRPWAPHKRGLRIRGASASGGYATAVLQFNETSMVPARGSAATISAVTSGVATLTGGTGFTAAMVGSSLVVEGCATALNNGAFPIVEYVSATSVKYGNPNAVAPDANNGAIRWKREAGCGVIFNDAAYDFRITDLAVYGTEHWDETTARANSTAYAVGALARKPRNNAYVFECIQAGTSAGAAPAALTNATQYDAYHLGWGDSGETTDGTVKWLPTIASGIVVRTHGWVERCDALYWTTAGIHGQAGADEVALNNNTNANLTHIVENRAFYCGVGIHLTGNDFNQGTICRNDINLTGQTRQSLYADGGIGALGGGHGIWDSSFLGNKVADNHWGSGYGHPFLVEGAAQYNKDVSNNYSESGSIESRITGPGVRIGGNIITDTDATTPTVASEGAWGFQFKDKTHAKQLWCAPVVNDGSNGLFLKLYSAADDVSQGVSWGYQYNGVGTGKWAFAYGGQNAKNAFWVSSTTATEGPGWFGVQHGYFLGALARGNDSSLTDKQLRGGSRVAGDEFDNGTTKTRVLAAGYRAPAWTVNTLVAADYAPQGFFGSTCTPTTSTGKTEGGEQVWECTTGGTTDATTEPTWPASPTPGVTTQADGTAVWTFVGYTPAIEVEQRTEKTRLQTRLKSTQTTTAAASQVIESGGVVDGVDLALPDNSIVRVTDLIILKKDGTATGGSIEIKSDWVRDGGAPTQLGASVITYNLSGATLDGTTVAHVANGNRIELQGSPESAEALNWRVFRTQAEGVD